MGQSVNPSRKIPMSKPSKENWICLQQKKGQEEIWLSWSISYRL